MFELSLRPLVPPVPTTPISAPTVPLGVVPVIPTGQSDAANAFIKCLRRPKGTLPATNMAAVWPVMSAAVGTRLLVAPLLDRVLLSLRQSAQDRPVVPRPCAPL